MRKGLRRTMCLCSAPVRSSRRAIGQLEAMISISRRASYNYDDRYIELGTFRRGGSSICCRQSMGLFPGRFGGMGHFRRNRSGAMPRRATLTFKLRASYGQTGNNGIGLYDAYGAFATGTYHGHTTLLPSAMANSAGNWGDYHAA